LGALLGEDREVATACIKMLHQYERVEYRLHHEFDSEHGGSLGLTLFLFNIQLILRDWLDDQTHTGQRFAVPAPGFAQHIKVSMRQNNLHWLP
jgi:hypothetical protein